MALQLNEDIIIEQGWDNPENIENLWHGGNLKFSMFMKKYYGNGQIKEVTK